VCVCPTVVPGCILTVVSLMQALDGPRHSAEITSMLQKLRSVDPYRQAYYQDLCEPDVM